VNIRKDLTKRDFVNGRPNAHGTGKPGTEGP